jgi:hypothetical protein
MILSRKAHVLRYPARVCPSCGSTDGKSSPLATWHYGTCDRCGKTDTPVAEPRDFRSQRRDKNR